MLVDLSDVETDSRYQSEDGKEMTACDSHMPTLKACAQFEPVLQDRYVSLPLINPHSELVIPVIGCDSIDASIMPVLWGDEIQQGRQGHISCFGFLGCFLNGSVTTG